MVRNIIVVVAWLVLGIICYVTLSPLGFRPQSGFSAGIERFIAFTFLGALFVAAYPRHFVRLASFIAIVALGLEVLQHLTPDRHGQAMDLAEKVAGGLVGCSFARMAQIAFGSPDPI